MVILCWLISKNMKEQNLIIKDRFKNAFTKLSTDEYNKLEKLIIENKGLMYPIVTWNNIIIDGHHRFVICKKHNFEIKTVEKEFVDENEAEIWLREFGGGRRNLNDFCKIENEKKISELQLKLIGKKNMPSGLSITDKAHNTRNIIAKKLDVSTGQVGMFDVVVKHVDEKTKEELREGKKTINSVYEEVKKKDKIEKRKELIESVKEKIKTENLTITNKYDVLVLDPPWNYGREYDPDTSRVANPYPEMTVGEISKIELPIKDTAVIFLWTTHAFLKDAFTLLDKWKLTYKATLVWDKEQMGMGNTIRMQCEFCLLAIKGSPIIQGSSTRDIIRESRREHSRKPESFYQLVDKITMGTKLDYFSRENREGWSSFGAETNKFKKE